MKKLLIEESFPTLKTDLAPYTAQVENTGELPPLQGIDTATAIDLRLWHVKYLMLHERQHDAAVAIDAMVFDDSIAAFPLLHHAWLWRGLACVLRGFGRVFEKYCSIFQPLTEKNGM